MLFKNSLVSLAEKLQIKGLLQNNRRQRPAPARKQSGHEVALHVKDSVRVKLDSTFVFLLVARFNKAERGFIDKFFFLPGHDLFSLIAADRIEDLRGIRQRVIL